MFGLVLKYEIGLFMKEEDKIILFLIEYLIFFGSKYFLNKISIIFISNIHCGGGCLQKVLSGALKEEVTRH